MSKLTLEQENALITRIANDLERISSSVTLIIEDMMDLSPVKQRQVQTMVNRLIPRITVTANSLNGLILDSLMKSIPTGYYEINGGLCLLRQTPDDLDGRGLLFFPCGLNIYGERFDAWGAGETVSIGSFQSPEELLNPVKIEVGEDVTTQNVIPSGWYHVDSRKAFYSVDTDTFYFLPATEIGILEFDREFPKNDLMKTRQQLAAEGTTIQWLNITVYPRNAEPRELYSREVPSGRVIHTTTMADATKEESGLPVMKDPVIDMGVGSQMKQG